MVPMIPKEATRICTVLKTKYDGKGWCVTIVTVTVWEEGETRVTSDT
jgi:hypothetical protein